MEHAFYNDSAELFQNFMRMLLFDSLVGNNDRHMYNWGVIKSIYGNKKPYYSPIYDSARGLLWNEKENKIDDIINNDMLRISLLKKYCEKSRPKIGVENNGNVNHFDLINHYKEFYINDKLTRSVFSNNVIDNIILIINSKYNKLFSKNRRTLITDILIYRYKRVKNILSLP